MPVKKKDNTQRKVIGPSSKKQEMFLNSSADITCAGGAAGSGKALRHGEKVLLTSGFVNIEDVKVGDKVVTPKNTVETVTGVFPQGKVKIYRVTFHDGSTVDTCGEHLWKWRVSGYRNYKVSSTLDILKWMNARDSAQRNRRPLVDLISPVEFGTKEELPVLPYTLGVLLGDGSISTNSVSFITQDEEIRHRVESEGYVTNQWCKDDSRTTAKTYGVLGIQQSLRSMGLIGTRSHSKFIPPQYKTASIEDRFALVQGLMDTDGYVCVDGSTSYCTVSERLKDDLVDILHSLGFTATVTEKHPSYRGSNGERIYGKLAYEIYIRGRDQARLFSIHRKVSRTKRKLVCNAITEITEVGYDFATCISISGDDKLFITSNFIPTHNTFTSLLIALKFMQHPMTTGVIFRRTSTMLKSAGGIWQEAIRLYSDIYPKGLKIRTKDSEIVFPNGAVLKFSHMQHESNMYDHKGGQYSLVIFDEATDFTENMVTYLQTRMRNAYVNYKPQMFLMTNPDYNSFLRTWIQDFYLDADGIPIDERSGVVRYYFRQGANMHWAGSREELQALYGEDASIQSFTFIGARCTDNPHLMKADPTYASRLLAQSPVEAARLYYGSWFARPEAAGHWKREWCNTVAFPNALARKRVRTWDIASSLPSPQYPDPDWTRGVLVSKDSANLYTVEDMASLRDRSHKVRELIINTALMDGRGVTIGLPCDPGAQAGAWARDLQRTLGEMGFNCKLIKPQGSKAARFAPFSTISQAGFVEVVNAPWYSDFCVELENFDPEIRRQHDDIVDAVSDATFLLNQEIQVPTVSVPRMKSTYKTASMFGQTLPKSGVTRPKLV